jgi:acetate kinase
MKVLAINVGSSSLKIALFDGDQCLDRRSVEEVKDPARALEEAVASMAPPEAVGHRFVHGGPTHHQPLVVDAASRRELQELVRFAPLHMPAELAVLDAAIARFPKRPQVACFDTAFHRSMPEAAERLPLPRPLYDDGVRRYGFHGLSYEYVVASVGKQTLGRAVLAHLGSGASMVAVRDGRSIDTTMGFTPTGGLIMGTRTGDVDPGVMVHLMDYGHDARTIERMVNQQSGLLGISGTTGNMKELLAASVHDERAALAVEMFARTARKFVGALAAVLGGIETLVFTGGIGENSAAVRAQICEGLEHLGVRLDAERNARAERVISADAAPCAVRVVVTDEEQTIARHVARVLG